MWQANWNAPARAGPWCWPRMQMRRPTCSRSGTRGVPGSVNPRERESAMRKKQAKSKIQFHFILEKGWLHTHGMDRHGLPELEVRNVPGFLAGAAAGILDEVCDYMLTSGKTVKAGETMGLGSNVRFRFVRPEPPPGDEDHYKVERLRLE